MKSLKLETGRDGTPNYKYTGASFALQRISDAILRDRRMFHLSGNNWMSMYERQVMYETLVCRGWTNDVGPQLVLQEAQLRIKKEGWDGSPPSCLGARKAISTKVHTWITRAFLMTKLGADIQAAESLYSEVLDFLNEGRKIWKDIDVKVRGIVFEHSFVTGICILHLNAYMEATSKLRKGKYGVSQLREVAECLYQDSVVASAERPSPRPRESDVGFESSFYVCPIGEALCTMAYCELQTAYEEKKEEVRKQHFRTAAELYLQSTKFFFEDDEYHSYFLVMSLKSHWLAKSSLRATLPIMQSLREVNPKMLQIWQHSGFGLDGHRDRSIKYCLDFLDRLERKIASGATSEDAELTPADHIVDVIG